MFWNGICTLFVYIFVNWVAVFKYGMVLLLGWLQVLHQYNIHNTKCPFTSYIIGGETNKIFTVVVVFHHITYIVIHIVTTTLIYSTI